MSNDAVSRLWVELHDVGATVHSNHADGTTHTFDVSFATLGRTLLGNTYISSGLLPLNTIGYKVRDRRAVVYIYRPEGKRVITYSKKYVAANKVLHRLMRHEVMVPHTIWEIETEEENNAFSVCHTRVFAIKSNILEYDTPLFVYPYPNVNTDGSVCWGSASPVATMFLQGLHQLLYITELIYTSPFNDDYGMKLRTLECSGDMRKYLKTYKNCKPFPYDLLHSHDLTLGNLIAKGGSFNE